MRDPTREAYLVRPWFLGLVGDIIEKIPAELASLVLELREARIAAEVGAADRVDVSDVVVGDAGHLAVEHLDVASVRPRWVARIGLRRARARGQRDHEKRGGPRERAHGRASAVAVGRASLRRGNPSDSRCAT